MNKAFIKEPEFDGRACCPRCGTLGAPVEYAAIDELRRTVYPKDLDAPICACFGLTYDDVAADVRDGTPHRIRELLAKSKTSAAQCERLAADGRSCIGAVQELYMKLRSDD